MFDHRSASRILSSLAIQRYVSGVSLDLVSKTLGTSSDELSEEWRSRRRWAGKPEPSKEKKNIKPSNVCQKKHSFWTSKLRASLIHGLMLNYGSLWFSGFSWNFTANSLILEGNRKQSWFLNQKVSSLKVCTFRKGPGTEKDENYGTPFLGGFKSSTTCMN